MVLDKILPQFVTDDTAVIIRYLLESPVVTVASGDVMCSKPGTPFHLFQITLEDILAPGTKHVSVHSNIKDDENVAGCG